VVFVARGVLNWRVRNAGAGGLWFAAGRHEVRRRFARPTRSRKQFAPQALRLVACAGTAYGCHRATAHVRVLVARAACRATEMRVLSKWRSR